MSTLSELRRLLAEATPGPWLVWHDGDADGVCTSDGEREVVLSAALWEPEALLIVALRNHAEALIDVAEAARGCATDGSKTFADVRAALGRLDEEPSQ